MVYDKKGILKGIAADVAQPLEKAAQAGNKKARPSLQVVGLFSFWFCRSGHEAYCYETFRAEVKRIYQMNRRRSQTISYLLFVLHAH